MVKPVQFIVTTHSPHMANKASFESLRYFLSKPCQKIPDTNICSTTIKDLKKGLNQIHPDDKVFLHKYMVLTRCDLLFADKIILIEGPTERIILPEIIRKVDLEIDSDSVKLSSQYISILEVGGAYAHIFFELLDFLDLKTLIITDIDSIDEDGKACEVSLGQRTSNNCIKKWFSNLNISLQEILNKNDNEKINGIRRISYQVPEEIGNKMCGRSFEDAFILANEDVDSSKAYEKAKTLKKTDFALDKGIFNTDWEVPRYIKEGLIWLANSSNFHSPTHNFKKDESSNGQ